MLFVFYFIVAIISGAIGSSMAKSRDRDAAVWFIVCALFPLIGIIALAIAGNASIGSYIDTQATATTQSIPVVNQKSALRPTNGRASKDYDVERWRALAEFDQDIQAAVGRLGTYGEIAVDRLAKAYLAIGDKGMLPKIVSKIIEDESAAAAEKAAKREQDDQNRTEIEKGIMAQREIESKLIMKEIVGSNMYCKENRKIVSEMEMYYGRNHYYYGYLKITFTDGTIELRSGRSCFVVGSEEKFAENFG